MSEIPRIELIIGDANDELASTRRVLERFPDGKGDWRPDNKSRTLGQLAVHVASQPGLGTSIVTTSSLDAAARPPLPTIDTAREMVELFDARAGEFHQAVAAADDKMLDETWSLGAGGRVYIELPKRRALRTMFLNHLIHHRAQIGVYYRLLGVPVPGLYGPTADEPLGM